MDGIDIKRSLELEFDIPFAVTKTYDNGEPVFLIGPENDVCRTVAVSLSAGIAASGKQKGRHNRRNCQC